MSQGQEDVTRTEARIASSLRESAESLITRTATLLRSTDRIIERLAPQLEEALAPEDGVLTAEGADHLIGLMERLSRVVKTNAEAAEKTIRVERQVRGDPTDTLAVTGIASPETTEQVVQALQEELAALNRPWLNPGNED